MSALARVSYSRSRRATATETAGYINSNTRFFSRLGWFYYILLDIPQALLKAGISEYRIIQNIAKVPSVIT